MAFIVSTNFFYLGVTITFNILALGRIVSVISPDETVSFHSQSKRGREKEKGRERGRYRGGYESNSSLSLSVVLFCFVFFFVRQVCGSPQAAVVGRP